MLVVLPDPVTGANPALVNGESPSPTTLVTRYTYDEVGNKLTQTDAEGRTTRWEYDAMGRETARVLPEGQRETRTYNDAGELETHTDFNGVTTRYDYDLAGRLETIDYPRDADVGFGYNARGERTSAVDARGTSTTQFDARSRTVQVHDADGGLIEYEYDAAGNLLARISPSQSLVYTYDDANRLQTVTRTVDGEAPTVTDYDYDDAGNRSVMIGGDGTRTEYTYDRRNRLTRLLKKTAAGALLVGMTYGVDATGMRTAIEETDPAGVTRTVAYTYDGVKRLTSETIDHREAAHDRATAWTYDRVGNRQTQTLTTTAGTEITSYAYDANDRLLTETNSVSGATTYGYDDNGNTLSKTTATESTTYAYDDANRLVQAITPAATVDYVYNADGLRVRLTVTLSSGQPTTTWYLQDSGYAYAQVVEEYTSNGAAARTLAATFTFADDLVSQTRYVNGTPTTRFIQEDGFGSTRWLSDAAGAITDKVDYDAFGVEISRAGATAIAHLYRGEAFDPNVGFYYLRARWMDPGNGRFTTQDTFAGFSTDPRSLHKYAYASTNPVNGTDPSGHMTMMDMTAAQNVMGQLMRMSFQTLNVIDKASTVLNVIQMVWQINNIIENPIVAQQAEQVLDSADPDFKDLIKNRMSDALANFKRNSAKVVASSVQLHGSDIMNTAIQGAAGRDRGYLIFLPTPTGIANAVRMDVPLGRVSFKGKSVKVKGRIGGAASHLGRVIGAGSYTGRSNYQQYFRMDYDAAHGHHGSSGPYHWTDGHFHYHIR